MPSLASMSISSSIAVVFKAAPWNELTLPSFWLVLLIAFLFSVAGSVAAFAS